MKDVAKTAFCKSLLERKHGYNMLRAERIYEQLSNSDNDIQIAALQWIESDEEASFSAEGWSVERLKEEFGMNYLAAILTIDWLRKDPQAALAAIRDGIK